MKHINFLSVTIAILLTYTITQCVTPRLITTCTSCRPALKPKVKRIAPRYENIPHNKKDPQKDSLQRMNEQQELIFARYRASAGLFENIPED
jgi:hypothetical protein